MRASVLQSRSGETATLEPARAPAPETQAPHTRAAPVTRAEEAERVVQLARLLAERVVGHALETTDEALGHFAVTLLAETGGSRSLALYAHPADAARLRRVLGAHDLGERTLLVVDDAALLPGALRFETAEGSLEADAKACLETLSRVALARLVSAS